jgi:hypothetical protein
LLDRDQAGLDQVEAVEEPGYLGLVAVALDLVCEPVIARAASRLGPGNPAGRGLTLRNR